MKIESRSWLFIISIVILGCSTAAHDDQHRIPFAATPLSLAPNEVAAVKNQMSTPNDFEVDFYGIICHAKLNPKGDDSTPRRAIIIRGNMFSMTHHATLSVHGADEASLRDVSGQTVTCTNTDQSKPPGTDPASDDCSVRIDGFDMQIRDEHNNPPSGTLIPSPCYLNLPPRLASVPGLKDSRFQGALLNTDMPSSPAAGYFEIDGGGDLTAAPFKTGGYYEGQPPNTCHQFADGIYWSGNTVGRPSLQIRALHNSSRWESVKMVNTTDPLQIIVRNDPTNATHTTTHFALNNKVLFSGRLPSIAECGYVCPPQLPLPQVCYSCQGSKAEASLALHPFVDIAGCSNTTWP